MQKYRLSNIRFSRHQQKKLFERDFNRQELIADRYLKKRCRRGFKIKKLQPFTQDITMALFKEGDFRDDSYQRKQCSKRILDDIQSDDVKRIKKLFDDKNFWLKKMKLSRKKYTLMRNACQQECRRTRSC